MKPTLGVKIFGIIEIIIGVVTLIAVATSIIFGVSRKPPEVLVFVLITASLSLILGAGILKNNLTCYQLLLFFSVVIILSKVLIFAKIITLSGALETKVSPTTKNIISIIYHGILIAYFKSKSGRRQFNIH